MAVKAVPMRFNGVWRRDAVIDLGRGARMPDRLDSGLLPGRVLKERPVGYMNGLRPTRRRNGLAATSRLTTAGNVGAWDCRRLVSRARVEGAP